MASKMVEVKDKKICQDENAEAGSTYLAIPRVLTRPFLTT